ncbi:hypothetical protein D3C85_1297700 [compost metagenome]
MKVSMPRSAYSFTRAATVRPSPTRAVPAPPRTRPTPAQRLGLTSSWSRLPLCRAAMRCWPTESKRAKAAWALAMVASSRFSIRRSAAAQAASLVSRTITCRRMPKRTVRPCFAALTRTCSIFSFTAAGGSPQVR